LESRPLPFVALNDLSLEHHPFTKAMLFDQRSGDERIVLTPRVVVFRFPEEAIAFGMQFEDALDDSHADAAAAVPLELGLTVVMVAIRRATTLRPRRPVLILRASLKITSAPPRATTSSTTTTTMVLLFWSAD